MRSESWFVLQIEPSSGLQGGSSCASVSSLIVGTLAGVEPSPDGRSTGVTKSTDRVFVVEIAALEKYEEEEG